MQSVGRNCIETGANVCPLGRPKYCTDSLKCGSEVRLQFSQSHYTISAKRAISRYTAFVTRFGDAPSFLAGLAIIPRSV
jgi:hypothetical protein